MLATLAAYKVRYPHVVYHGLIIVESWIFHVRSTDVLCASVPL
jgi:hypothetical protein